ncbi:MAG: efflux transporter, family, subunit [Paenibacillus sp.]|nr:efflux transporter, family, subunit [Paenibacillus sp.]
MLALLTLAGNTIQSMTLPKAYTAETQQGELAYEFRGTTTVIPSDVRELVNPAGWKVAKVLAEKGETVSKGQPLVLYDDAEAGQALADTRSALKKLELSIESLQHQYKLAYLGEDETARIGAKLAIETAKLDIADLKRRMEAQESVMEKSRQLIAPFDGTVLEVRATEGATGAGAADIVMSNGAEGFAAELAIPEDIAGLLEPGEELELLLEGGNSRMIAGTIISIEATGGQNGGGEGTSGGEDGFAKVKLTLKDGELQGEERLQDGEGLQGGERLQVDLKLTGEKRGVLVPVDAVHHDLEGTYVYTLEERPGFLGNAYYTVRTPIVISGSNESATLVESGLFQAQKIVISSSEPIMNGMRVRII